MLVFALRLLSIKQSNEFFADQDPAWVYDLARRGAIPLRE